MDDSPVKAIFIPSEGIQKTSMADQLLGASDEKTVNAGAFRVKRNADSLASYCRLHEDLVDFDKFGSEWNRFIAPRRFNVNQARGSCPPFWKTDGLPYNSIVSKDYEFSCVPTEYRGIEFLYYTAEGQVRIDLISNVVAVQAGCR